MLGSPFTADQAQALEALVAGMTPEQRAWLGGYLAGLQAAGLGAAPAALPQAPAAGPAAPAPPEVTVVYGSQTGNAAGLARRLADRVRGAGLAASVHSLGDFEARQLRQAQRLLLVTSTQGDGDPPDNAIAFRELLQSRKAPRLEHLRYAVLGLGDSSYEHFNQTARDFDTRLAELGATPLHPRAECDLDYEEAAAAWIEAVVAVVAADAAPGGPVPAGPAAASAPPSAAPAYSRTHPFPAEVLDNVELHGRGADRSTRHVELSLAGSGLSWEPGDSLGVFARNDQGLVELLLRAADWDPATPLEGGAPIGPALAERYEITVLTRPMLAKIAEVTGSASLAALLRPEREADLRAYLAGRDLIDLIQDHGLRGVPARDLVAALRRLPPRLYSIASSPAACPEEPHLTVRLLDYQAHGRPRRGVCSSHLASLAPGDTVPVFVQSNPNFRLPADPAAPVIMIGPGTGVAPFRAFLEERAEAGAPGRNWLFFGDRRFRTDFLYQTDWQRWRQKGVLTRMDVAFSRDRAEKVYVQHRMLQHGRELYAWLQDGAAVYVCGDEKRMAPDVHEALAGILMREGGCDRDAAEERLSQMRRERRYQRDVY